VYEIFENIYLNDICQSCAIVIQSRNKVLPTVAEVFIKRYYY